MEARFTNIRLLRPLSSTLIENSSAAAVSCLHLVFLQWGLCNGWSRRESKHLTRGSWNSGKTLRGPADPLHSCFYLTFVSTLISEDAGKRQPRRVGWLFFFIIVKRQMRPFIYIHFLPKVKPVTDSRLLRILQHASINVVNLPLHIIHRSWDEARVCHERLRLSLLTRPHLCAPWHRSLTLAATRAHWWTWPLARSHTLKKQHKGTLA